MSSGRRGNPKLDTANAFRFSLFNCFCEDDLAVRFDSLRCLGFVVDFWTQSWLENESKEPLPLSPRPGRPSYARHSSSGSPHPSRNGGILRRDSSFKMNFDEVFGLEADDGHIPATPVRKNSGVPSAPLTPEKEFGWKSELNECAISPSESSLPKMERDVRFYNKKIGTLDSISKDLMWAAKAISEEIWGLEEMKINLDNYYSWLLRFSVDCPFEDVRTGCGEILMSAEKSGAQLPHLPVAGPSQFIPVYETIGLSSGSWTPVTPSLKSPSPFDIASEDEEEGILSSPKEFSGVMIPDRRSTTYNERARSRSRGRTPVSSIGRQSSRRATVSLVSTLFQTPPSSPTGSQKLKRRNNPRRPIPKFLSKPKTPSDEVRGLQLNAFQRTGRVGNLNKVLFYFPKFAKVCQEATNIFLSDNSMYGPLPQKWRIYLGILAAAEKRSQYYLSLLAEKFISHDGDKEWLKGLSFAPAKLQRIGKLNMLLAHQPWNITDEHIRELVSGTSNPELRWSMAEVVHAVLVLSFYHCKSAMALGWAIVPEPDLLGGAVGTFIQKGTPVAPFGSYTQSSLSTEAKNGTFRNAKPASEIDRPDSRRSHQPSGLSTGKREFPIPGNQYSEKAPNKWRRTAQRSLAQQSYPDPIISSPVNVPTPVRKTVSNIEAIDRRRFQKRRKSFEECATSDDAPLPIPSFAQMRLSSSAPNSYIPPSILSSLKPVATSLAKEQVLSPSSSASSAIDVLSSVGDQAPVNSIVEDYTRFLCAESLDRSASDSDPSNSESEFLPMEEFEWGIASSYIADYLDSGVVEMLDEYFKEALSAEAEDEALFASAVQYKLHENNGDSTPLTVEGFDDVGDADHNERMNQFFSPDSRSESIPRWGTKSVKEAAWYYSLRLVNIQKDDFRYSEVKDLLDKGARRYLKRVACRPESMTSNDWIGLMDMSNKERCCLSLLGCQARFLGQILWVIKATADTY